MDRRTYSHPSPLLKRAIEVGALVMCLVMLIGALTMMALPLLGAPSGFLLAGPLLILLAAPVLMLTAYAPAVTLDAHGITLHPAIWQDRHIPWETVAAVKVYPLLPSPDEESVRRHLIGVRSYKPAQGIMLVVPSLPAQYRIVGYLAGVGGKPAVVLTNRAHRDFDHLVEDVLNLTNSTIHDPELYYASD